MYWEFDSIAHNITMITESLLAWTHHILVASMRRLIYFLSLLINLIISIYLRRTATSNKRYYCYYIWYPFWRSDVLASSWWSHHCSYSQLRDTALFSGHAIFQDFPPPTHSSDVSYPRCAFRRDKFLEPVASAGTTKWTTSAAVA